MDIEFIIKDKRRIAVLNDLSVEEPLTLHRLVLKNHIPEGMMRIVIRSMEEKDIITLVEGGYELTEKGRGLIKEVRKLEKVPPHETSGAREGAQVSIAPDHKRKQIDRRRVP